MMRNYKLNYWNWVIMLPGLILNMPAPWEVADRYTCGDGDIIRNAVLFNSGDINQSENRKTKFM